jgi:hypothetical protein
VDDKRGFPPRITEKSEINRKGRKVSKGEIPHEGREEHEFKKSRKLIVRTFVPSCASW